MQSILDIEDIFIEIVNKSIKFSSSSDLRPDYIQDPRPQNETYYFDPVRNNAMFKDIYDYSKTINDYLDSIGYTEQLKYLSNIVNYNRISKTHYRWINHTTNHNYFKILKDALIWLRTQTVYKYRVKKLNCIHLVTINHDMYGFDNDMRISASHVENAVMYLNHLSSTGITNTKKIYGMFPYYSLKL